jgi:O-acetyl-ADP-ribose deacetylase (regulator of RNase III)
MMVDETRPAAGAAAPADAQLILIVEDSDDDFFVLAISRRWPEPESAYRAWYRDRANNDFALGAVQFVQVETDIWVANMIGQRGLRKGPEGPPIRYEAVSAGLAEVARKAGELQASVHMPRIGCGLAGGKWERIEPLILAELTGRGVEAYVYDFA